jgi:hypothetical protein
VPAPGRYDVIWIQWVIGHLTDGVCVCVCVCVCVLDVTLCARVCAVYALCADFVTDELQIGSKK